MLSKGKSTMAKTVDPQEPARNRLGQSTSIKGDIQSDGNFRIDGKLEGTIETKGKVVIGASGLVTGDVICSHADIEGTIKGRVKVSELLSLKSTAKIHGDISTDKLSIEPGAVFTGTCQMGATIKDIKDGERAKTTERKEGKTAS